MSTAIMEEPATFESPAPCPAPPRDRAIWVVANIIDRPEGTTIEPLGDQPPPPWDDEIDPFGMSATSGSVETYEGFAVWDEKAQDWHDTRGMSIRQFFGSEFRILSWSELAARAQNCPDSEILTSATVTHRTGDYWSEEGRSGFYAVVHEFHQPTFVDLLNRTKGPFGTRAEALAALTSMLGDVRPGGVQK